MFQQGSAATPTSDSGWPVDPRPRCSPSPPADDGRRRPDSRCLTLLEYAPTRCMTGPPIMIGLWRSLVARLVRDEEAAGSNPVSPTVVISQEISKARTHGSGFG